MTEKLYVWTDLIKAPFSVPADHTWVSTYEPNDSNPVPSNGDYWYCNGDARDHARLLKVGIGGADFARSIASPHDKTAKAGIEYKYDGVCHQIANRLLRFCIDNDEPITVEGAKGYFLSRGMYGIYGEKQLLTKAQRDRFQKWEDSVRDYEKNNSGDYDE